MIQVDIVTPSRKLTDGIGAVSVKLPAYKGEIEILPGHAELITLLNTGIVTLTGDGTQLRFAISYGLAEVRNDRVIVLAETAEESTEIDIERARAAQKKAEEQLSSALTEDKFKKYQLKLQRALIRQHTVRNQ